MIRVSTGTAGVIGLTRARSHVPPTTAYVMVGEGCTNDCGFCAQASSSSASARMLSRVSWIPIEPDVLDRSLVCSGSAFQRVCLQVVMCRDHADLVVDVIDRLNGLEIPLSVSAGAAAADVLGRNLLSMGVDRVAIPLDAANPELYRAIKGRDLDADMAALAAFAETGRVVTHLIIGLGETEEEAVRMVKWCRDRGIEVALFAFTPVPGTRLADCHPPDLATYRRIQVINRLLADEWPDPIIEFDRGRISSVGLSRQDLARRLGDGRAFQTSGCPGCNRPFYNERPGGPWYNYPRALNREEIEQCLESGAIGGEPM